MDDEAEQLPRPPAGFRFDSLALQRILRILRALPREEQADTLALVIRRFFDLAEDEQRQLEQEQRQAELERTERDGMP